MPVTGFMKVPDIKGESRAHGHKDEIDINGLVWGVSRVSDSAAGRRRLRTKVRDLTVLKSYDVSSPYLAMATLRGQAFDEIIVTTRKSTGEGHLDYLKITMTNCILTDYQMENDGLDDPLTVLSEAVDIEFDKIRIAYVEQTESGPVGRKREVDLDVMAGA